MNAQGPPGTIGGLKGALPTGHGAVTAPPPMGMAGLMGPGPMGGLSGGIGAIAGGMVAQGGVPLQQTQIIAQASQQGPGMPVLFS